MAKVIVDQVSLIKLVNQNNDLSMHAIGRALVLIFKRQTEDERKANTTNTTNMRGFTGADARKGSITAKYYIKHKKLLDWQIAYWLEPNVNNIPRIAKYHKQLNEEARIKAQQQCLPLK